MSKEPNLQGVMSMFDVLTPVEQALPQLLQDENAWHSLSIDYHPPTLFLSKTTTGKSPVPLSAVDLRGRSAIGM